MASEPEPFLLPIFPPQVQQMIHAVASTPGAGLIRLLFGPSANWERLTVDDVLGDKRDHARDLSHSLIASLIVFAAFSDGEEHRVTRAAAESGMNTTTTLRYVRTWVALGVLVQDQRTHRYRLVACSKECHQQ